MGAHSSSHQYHRSSSVGESSSSSSSHRLQRRTSRMSNAVDTASSTLSEADYKYIIEQTGLSRSEIKSIYNEFVKESVNGELDLDGFVEFYTSLSADRLTNEFLKSNAQFIFDTFDKDHNGKVSFREFMCAYVLTTPGNLEKKLEYTFELYDMDGNGYLDLDEIYRIAVRILNLLGDSKKSEQDAIRFAEEVVRKLDVNPKDGKVTKEEYVAGMINNPELRLLITPFVS